MQDDWRRATVSAQQACRYDLAYPHGDEPPLHWTPPGRDLEGLLIAGALVSVDSLVASAQPSIVVLSAITPNNLGDDATLVATVEDLRRMAPEAEIAVLAEDPSHCGSVAVQIDVPIFQSMHLFIRAFLAALPEGEDPNFAVLQMACEILGKRDAILQGKRIPWLSQEYAEGLRRLLSADGVVDCGGASLTVYWKPYFYEKCLDYLLAPQPLLISGQGIDRFDLPGDLDLLLAALSKATEITLREPVSERYLRSIGCEVSMRTTGDDALTLEPASPAHCRSLLSIIGINSDQPFLAFQYRHFFDYQEDRFYDLFAAFVDEAIHATGLPVVGVPMHFGAIDERNHLADVGRRLVRADEFHVVESHLAPADAKGIFAAAAAAFGISYHSAVFSLSSGTPFLGLHHGTHYTQKMQGLSELYNLPELAVPVDKTTPETFAQLLLAQLERKDSIRCHLLARHNALIKEVHESRRRFLEQVRPTLAVTSFETPQPEWVDRYLAFELKKKNSEVFRNTLQQALAREILAHAREREWKQATRDLLMLMRYYPRAFLRACHELLCMRLRRWLRIP